MNNKLSQSIQSCNNSLNKLKEGFENLNKTLPLNIQTIFGNMIQAVLVEEIEVKFLKDSIKIISKKPLFRERLAVLQSIFSGYNLTCNQHMTCVIYTLKLKGGIIE